MRRVVRRRAGAVVVDGNRVLLMGQNELGDHPHRWYHFPGGGIDDGETPEDAAVHELFEETGIKARCGPKLLTVFTGAYEHNYFLMDADDLTLGDCTGPEIVELPEAIEFAPEWRLIDELPTIPVWPRLAAEHLVAHLAGDPLGGDAQGTALEEHRTSWEGTPWHGPSRANVVHAVVIHGGRVALVGSGLPAREAGASDRLEDVARQVIGDELGLTVEVGARLTVVQRGAAIHTYFACRVAAAPADASIFVTATELDPNLEPAWLLEELPRWIAEPSPDEPMRFFEVEG